MEAAQQLGPDFGEEGYFRFVYGNSCLPARTVPASHEAHATKPNERHGRSDEVMRMEY